MLIIENNYIGYFMKNLIVFLFLITTCLSLLICSVSLYADIPSVKLYLGNGSFRNYNLSDIQNLSISKSQNKTMMMIYCKNMQTTSHAISNIDSIKFENNQTNYTNMVLYLVDASPKSYLLKDIDSINFFIPTELTPEITKITPTSAYIGDEIVITGKKFGSVQGTSFVTFGSVKAINNTGWSDTEIKVKVPTDATDCKVSVLINGVKSNEVDFTISKVDNSPHISAINPSSASVGDIITIIGYNFENNKNSSFVKINGTNVVDYISWKSNEIKVKVPDPAETSNGKLSVTVNNIKSNEVDFAINLKITKITPASAFVGDTITIAGLGFGNKQGSSFVTIHGSNATDYISWNTNEIKVKVPLPADLSNGKISVTLNSVKSNEVDFIIIPQIMTINPDTAYVGDNIAIGGISFESVQGISFVNFNGTNSTTYSNWSSNEINVQVPLDATSGKVYTSIKGVKSNELNFIVKPKISNIFPTNVQIGDILTITGTGFGTSGSSNVVMLNSLVVLNFIKWSSTEIKIKIPDEAGSGKISVIINDQKSNEVDFSVKLSITHFVPNNGSVGDTITIYGTGFGSVQNNSKVSFQGSDATEYVNWKENEIKVRIPKDAESGMLSVTSANIKSNEYNFTIIPYIESISPYFGKAGDIITIKGTGFAASRGSGQATFNATNGSDYISWSSTEIKVKVLPGEDSIRVEVIINYQKSNALSFIFFNCKCISSYTNVTIGSQVWMGENLDVCLYRNGDLIPQVKDPTQWKNLKTGAWCYYNNDSNNRAILGKLYNWYAVNDPRGLAPEGWHIPDENEWTTLIDYLGGADVAGGKMKETRTIHWYGPNEGATNSSGFTALPGGLRGADNGEFNNYRFSTNFWSSKGDPDDLAYVRFLYYDQAKLITSKTVRKYGFSVRCIKD